ncbi:hypothetical protein Pyrfu_1027 [Pyrolobus fumarii 1A]|uniref:Flavinylation-associated cytochrome domain-containing protein n=1 Tax=Pyrolobus fumarii (strain DSM 11204 / 1A) TaxID=694429 RepID=G0EES3_PYRF1|nr:DUF4405 domain-containing protein [Pyrolobus fumarii]AEM38895.1 hypothetical protein Pyrfu_1027 [Pyrolobus fumarii 1A]
MVNVYMTLRTVSVVLLAVFGLLTLISGMILATAPHGPGSGDATALGISKSDWNAIREIVAFIAAGAAVLHVYANQRALAFHFKRAVGVTPSAGRR